MADWDEDSSKLRGNLASVLREVRDAAVRRAVPSASDALQWQADTMKGFKTPNARYVGNFRGTKGLQNVRVWIGSHEGVAPSRVASELAEFQRKLRAAVDKLDTRYPAGADLDVDGLEAVLELAAWAHAEWVRIHPFANGNGRTARLWANYVLMRYGLPPVVRLRPRPDGGYGAAGAASMDGDWERTAAVFRKLLLDELSQP